MFGRGYAIVPPFLFISSLPPSRVRIQLPRGSAPSITLRLLFFLFASVLCKPIMTLRRMRFRSRMPNVSIFFFAFFCCFFLCSSVFLFLCFT